MYNDQHEIESRELETDSLTLAGFGEEQTPGGTTLLSRDQAKALHCKLPKVAAAGLSLFRQIRRSGGKSGRASDLPERSCWLTWASDSTSHCVRSPLR